MAEKRVCSIGSEHGGLRKRLKEYQPWTVKAMTSFSTDYPELHSNLKSAFNVLVYGHRDGALAGKHLPGNTVTDEFVLIPLKILTCNASHAYPFSNANCIASQYHSFIRFHNVFEAGIQVLFDYLKSNKIPDKPQEKEALNKLLAFTANQDPILDAKGTFTFKKETCVFLMNHLIAQLSSCSKWQLDEGCHGKPYTICPCGRSSCPEPRPSCADLSFGDTRVWHGAVDAMTYNNVGVNILDHPGHQKHFLEEDCMIEIKHSCLEIEENIEQLYSEGITFSFLMKKEGVEASFVPVIGLKRDAAIITMYDPELDVLLTTKDIRFLKTPDDPVKQLLAYMVIWLTCNYKIFSTALNPELKQSVEEQKSLFPDFADEKLEIYQDELSFGHVRQRPKTAGISLPILSEANIGSEADQRYCF